MANENISLSSATRTNLLSLQKTTSLIDRTQERLSTGLKVNSALDDALAFFKARNLNNRASDLSTVKDGITEGINVIKAAIQGLDSIEGTLKQMKALAASARASSDSNTRSKLASQFNELRTQIDAFTQDASYNGVNLIKGSTSLSGSPAAADQLTVKFNEQTGTLQNTLVVKGEDSTVEALNVGSATATGTNTAGSWANSTASSYQATIDSAINTIDSALTTVRTTAQTFGTNSATLELRNDFTSEMINTLRGGAGQLVNADLNEESANMLSLQTRQQLGTISLSIAQQSEQSVLRLF